MTCADKVADAMHSRLDDIAEFLRRGDVEGLSQYGLDFSFCHQVHAYRYLISWGGPSEEILFYVAQDGGLIKATFSYKDWFDGAELDCTENPTVQLLHEWWLECGAYEVLAP